MPNYAEQDLLMIIAEQTVTLRMAYQQLQEMTAHIQKLETDLAAFNVTSDAKGDPSDPPASDTE